MQFFPVGCLVSFALFGRLLGVIGQLTSGMLSSFLWLFVLVSLCHCLVSCVVICCVVCCVRLLVFVPLPAPGLLRRSPSRPPPPPVRSVAPLRRARRHGTPAAGSDDTLYRAPG